MKQKTHSGASKRFRITAGGKVMHRRSNRNHMLEHKPTTRMRRLWRETTVSAADTKRVKRLLGR